MKLDFIKRQCLQNISLRKWKMQALDWENVIAKPCQTKNMYLQYTKGFLQFNKKEASNSIKNR
jgi:hypothetical protein